MLGSVEGIVRGDNPPCDEGKALMKVSMLIEGLNLALAVFKEVMKIFLLSIYMFLIIRVVRK